MIDNPNPYIISGDNQDSAVVPSLIQYHSETSANDVRGQELTEPLMTVDTSPRYALSVANIMRRFVKDDQISSGSVGSSSLPSNLVTAHILTLRNNMDGQLIDEPLSTIACSGAHHAEVQAFLIKYFQNGAAKSIDDPLDTVTTRDRFALVTVHGEECKFRNKEV